MCTRTERERERERERRMKTKEQTGVGQLHVKGRREVGVVLLRGQAHHLAAACVVLRDGDSQSLHQERLGKIAQLRKGDFHALVGWGGWGGKKHTSS